MTLIDLGPAEISANENELQRLTDLFHLLSDKTRLNILMLLSGGERNVTSLCNALRLPQPTVSHHLGLLREGNVILNRRNGKQVFYHLNGPTESAHADSGLAENGSTESREPGLGIEVGPFWVRIRRAGDGFSIGHV